MSSIIPGTIDPKRYMQVLKHQRVTIEPTVNDQNAISSNAVDVKWFVRDNKVRRYDRYETGAFATSDAVNSSVQWLRKLLGTSVENFPQFRSRLYLLIRVTDYAPSDGTGDAGSYDSPSFSYCIRRKLLAFGNGGGEV